MKNFVQMGRLSGSKIYYRNDELIFRINHRDVIPIDENIVDYVDCLGTIENRSFLSGLFRGWLGKMMGNTAWIAAIQSAKPNILYNLRVTYRDGSRSIVLVDHKLYLKFMEMF